MCIKPIENLARSALYPRRQSLLSNGWTIYNSPVCDLPRINKLLPHKIHSIQGMMHRNVNRGVLTPRKKVLCDNRPNTLQHKLSFEHLSFWPINAAWGSRFRPQDFCRYHGPDGALIRQTGTPCVSAFIPHFIRVNICILEKSVSS